MIQNTCVKLNDALNSPQKNNSHITNKKDPDIKTNESNNENSNIENCDDKSSNMSNSVRSSRFRESSGSGSKDSRLRVSLKNS